MQHVRDHGHDHRQRERGDRRRSDHDAELPLDREVSEPANQPASGKCSENATAAPNVADTPPPKEDVGFSEDFCWLRR
jgi:hypothetical protein